MRAAEEVDILFRQQGDDVLVEQFVLPGDQRVRGLGYRPVLLARRQAVRRTLGQVGADLLLEPGHPYLEEFVHVAGKDAEKLQPLQQGHARVVGLGQHAALKLEDAEFAVDESVGAGRVHDLVSRMSFNDKRPFQS